MADASSAFYQALLAGDAARCREIWAVVGSHLPQPDNLAEAEVIMHRARTEAHNIPLSKRVYSHDWLVERKYCSGLPDELKPKRDQVVPTLLSAVGVCVSSRSTFIDRKEECKEIESVMAQAGGEMIDAGIFDKARTQKRMWDAKDQWIRRKI